MTGPVTIPTVLSFILGATVDVTLLAYGARRLLAERRFSLSRTIVAGLAGQALTSTIFTAMASGWHLGAHQPSPGTLPPGARPTPPCSPTCSAW